MPMCDPDLDESSSSTNPVIVQSGDTPMDTDVPDVCYEVEDVIDHRWRNGWKFLTWWKGFPPSQATWEPPSTFVLSTGSVNERFRDYLKKEGLDALLRKALGTQFTY